MDDLSRHDVTSLMEIGAVLGFNVFEFTCTGAGDVAGELVDEDGWREDDAMALCSMCPVGSPKLSSIVMRA